MTISSEQRATIRRLFYAEHWKVGTIAAEMELAADTVKRAILTDAFVSNGANARSTLLDPYKPMVAMTLEQYPRLRATRLYDMLVARGFLGSVRQVRRYVSKVRPPRGRKAYLRTRTMPGEFGQVDWGSFGKVSVRGGERSLSLFLMALPYSRALAGEFTYDQRMDAFLRGHGHAFEEFEGAPRVMLYDNLKSVVLERIGDHVRFHDDLLEFAGHYHYMPRPCRPYCPEEKGTVERAIQYIRGSFFEGRKFSSLDDLNAQFREWLDTHAMARVHPTDEERRTVREVFEEERARLLPLPAHQPTTDRVQPIRSGKQPYVRFDGNDYSIPHTLVRVPLTLAASDTRVRVLDGASVVADHARNWNKRQVVEDVGHLDDFVREKRRGKELRGRDRLRALCPHADTLLDELAQRNEPLRQTTARLNQLLDAYGERALDAAIVDTLASGAPAVGSIAYRLERARRAAGDAIPLAISMPDHVRAKDVVVVPHDMRAYDELGRDIEDDGDDQVAETQGDS